MAATATPYCDIQDVKARAGRLRDAWDDTTQPNDGDLERFIRDAGTAVNVAMAALGFPNPATDVTVVDALRPVVADMALMMALAATWPGSTAGKDVQALYDDVSMRVGGKDGKGGYLGQLSSGTFPAFVLLKEEDVGDSSGMASFWQKEVGYSSVLDDWQTGGAYIDDVGVLRIRSPIGPGIHRDTRF